MAPKRKATPSMTTRRSAVVKARLDIIEITESLTNLREIIDANTNVLENQTTGIDENSLKVEVEQAVMTIQSLTSFVKAVEKKNIDITAHSETLLRTLASFGVEQGEEVGGDEQFDEDICLVGGALLLESETICPLTKKTMKRPIRNTHPTTSCKHHIESTSLNTLLTASRHSVRCPVQHCTGVWGKNHFASDQVYAARIQLFLKRKKEEQQKSVASAAQDIIDLT